jgi:hypothetical protein
MFLPPYLFYIFTLLLFAPSVSRDLRIRPYVLSFTASTDACFQRMYIAFDAMNQIKWQIVKCIVALAKSSCDCIYITHQMLNSTSYSFTK